MKQESRQWDLESAGIVAREELSVEIPLELKEEGNLSRKRPTRPFQTLKDSISKHKKANNKARVFSLRTQQKNWNNEFEPKWRKLTHSI